MNRWKLGLLAATALVGTTVASQAAAQVFTSPPAPATTVTGLTLPGVFTCTGVGSVSCTWASQNPNLVFVSPNGTSGQPGFRSLVGADLPFPGASSLGGTESYTCASHQWAASLSTLGVESCTQPAAGDISGLAASATTDTTNANNISSGTLACGRMPTITGDMSNTSCNFTLGTSGVSASSYGDSTHWPTFTVDAKGRITVASQQSAPIGLSASGSPQQYDEACWVDATHVGQCGTSHGGMYYGAGAPASSLSSTLPTGSFYSDISNIVLYQNAGPQTAPSLVSGQYVGVNNSYTGTLPSAPTASGNNYMIGVCESDTSAPSVPGGWVEVTHWTKVNAMYILIVQRKVQSGDSATETFCGNLAGNRDSTLMEFTGLSSSSFSSNVQFTTGLDTSGNSETLNFTTTSAGTISICAGAGGGSGASGLLTLSGSSWTNQAAFTGNSRGVISGTVSNNATASAVSCQVNSTQGGFGTAAVLVVLQPVNAGSTGFQIVASSVPAGGVPTNSGPCAIGTQVGGSTGGSFVTTGGCSSNSVVLTLPAAPNGWLCEAFDQTTTSDTLKQSASSISSCTLTGTTAASDVILWKASKYWISPSEYRDSDFMPWWKREDEQ